MKRPSFSTQLVMLWALVAALCATLVALVWIVAGSAESEQIAGARAQGASACEAVASRYASSVRPSAAQPDTEPMHAILDIVLARAPDVEGGFWTRDGAGADGRFLAYAFPTYQGSGIKRDVPEAETPLIVRTLNASAATRTTATNVVEGAQDAVVAVACPVPAGPDLFVWTLTRAHPPLGRHGELLASGLAAVLAVILAIAAALAFALRRWKRNLARIEAALSPAGRNPQLPRVGEADLDRIIDAFNAHARHVERLQQQAGELAARLAQAERFGMLGKLAAQLAHEIRNPMGAMRLKAENALAADSGRQQDALRIILTQIARIDAQLSGLLALTQPVSPHIARVDLDAWLPAVVDAHRELAQRQSIALAYTPDGRGRGELRAADLESREPRAVWRAHARARHVAGALRAAVRRVDRMHVRDPARDAAARAARPLRDRFAGAATRGGRPHRAGRHRGDGGRADGRVAARSAARIADCRGRRCHRGVRGVRGVARSRRGRADAA